MTLLEILIAVRDGPKNDSLGICAHITNLYWAPYAMHLTQFAEIAEQWPEFSGNAFYPVPPGESAFIVADTFGTMWEGEYGAARLRLLDFAIAFLEAEC